MATVTASAPCDPASAASNPSRRRRAASGSCGGGGAATARHVECDAAGSRLARPPAPSTHADIVTRAERSRRRVDADTRRDGVRTGGQGGSGRGAESPPAASSARSSSRSSPLRVRCSPSAAADSATIARHPSRCAPRRGTTGCSAATPSTSANGSTSARGSSPSTTSRLGERHAHVAAGGDARPTCRRTPATSRRTRRRA